MEVGNTPERPIAAAAVQAPPRSWKSVVATEPEGSSSAVASSSPPVAETLVQKSVRFAFDYARRINRNQKFLNLPRKINIPSVTTDCIMSNLQQVLGNGAKAFVIIAESTIGPFTNTHHGHMIFTRERFSVNLPNHFNHSEDHCFAAQLCPEKNYSKFRATFQEKGIHADHKDIVYRSAFGESADEILITHSAVQFHRLSDFIKTVLDHRLTAYCYGWRQQELRCWSLCTDASYVSMNMHGYGAFLRDENGNLKGGLCFSEKKVRVGISEQNMPTVNEAVAAKLGVEKAKKEIKRLNTGRKPGEEDESIPKKVKVQTDSFNVAKSYSHGYTRPGYLIPYLKELDEVIENENGGVEYGVGYLNRLGNPGADILSAKAHGLERKYEFSDDYCPVWIRFVLIKDKLAASFFPREQFVYSWE